MKAAFIKALDCLVAFVTLEQYGVIDKPKKTKNCGPS